MNDNLNKIIPSWVMKRLDGRDNLKIVINNASWLFLDKLLRMGAGLIVGVLVARYLGPKQYGSLNYAQAFVALFMMLSTLGLDNIVIREIVKKPDEKNTTLGTAFVLKLIGGIVAILASLICISLLKKGDNLLLSLTGIIASGLAFQAFDVIDYWFQSQTKSKYTVLAKNAAFLISIIFKIYLLIIKGSVIAFAVVNLIEVVLGELFLILIYFKQKKSFHKWGFNIKHAANLLADSWPLMLSTLSVMIYMKIDLVMLGEMKGVEAVGIYSAASKISELWYFIPTIIVSSIFPQIVSSKNTSEHLYYEHIGKIFNIVVPIAYAIILPVSIFSNEIIGVIYGAKYTGSGVILSIHIWSGVFVFLGIAKSVWIITEGLSKYALFISVVGAIINITINLLLIPKYGPTGAALATLFSYICSDYILFLLLPRLRKIGIMMTKSLLLRKCY